MRTGGTPILGNLHISKFCLVESCGCFLDSWWFSREESFAPSPLVCVCAAPIFLPESHDFESSSVSFVVHCTEYIPHLLLVTPLSVEVMPWIWTTHTAPYGTKHCHVTRPCRRRHGEQRVLWRYGPLWMVSVNEAMVFWCFLDNIYSYSKPDYWMPQLAQYLKRGKNLKSLLVPHDFRILGCIRTTIGLGCQTCHIYWWTQLSWLNW